MIPWLATDAVATGSDHAGAEFVEDLERGLIAVQAELALELDGRDAWRMARNQVGGPEPDRQRRASPLHDSAGRQRIIPLTFAAPQMTDFPCSLIEFQQRFSAAAACAQYLT